MSVLPLEWGWIVWFIAISPVPTAARPIILVCTGQRDFLGHRILVLKPGSFNQTEILCPPTYNRAWNTVDALITWVICMSHTLANQLFSHFPNI